MNLSIQDKPSECYASGCPMASKAKKFVLDCGDPLTAKIAFLFEAPGKDEIAFSLPAPHRDLYSLPEQKEREIALRQRDYPNLAPCWIQNGVPVVGATWGALHGWVLNRFGLRREDMFICNVLHCLPPKSGTGDEPYPKGWERKKAESCCTQWSRLHLFKPDIAVVSLHPAGVLREVSPLPLQVKAVERAVYLMHQGYRPLVLNGGKAAKWWLGYAENVQKWVASYHWETPQLAELRQRRWEEGYKAAAKRKKAKGIPATTCERGVADVQATS